MFLVSYCTYSDIKPITMTVTMDKAVTVTATIAETVTVTGAMSVTVTVTQPVQDGDRDSESDKGNATNNDYDTGGAKQRQ